MNSFPPMNTCPSPSLTTQPCSSLISTTVSISGVPRGTEVTVLQRIKMWNNISKFQSRAVLNSKHLLVARLQQRFRYSVTACPAGHLSNTVEIIDVGFIVLVFPATQQSCWWAGFSTQSQYAQRGAQGEHILLENTMTKAHQQSGCDLWKYKNNTVCIS